MITEQPDVSRLISKEDEVLSEQTNELRRMLVIELLGDGERQPVAAEQLAGGCARTDVREELVVLDCQHWTSPFESSRYTALGFQPRGSELRMLGNDPPERVRAD